MSRYRGRNRFKNAAIRYLPTGLTLQELLEWIESLPEDEESHRQNILKFNDAIHDIIACGTEAVIPLSEHLVNTNNRRMRSGAIWALRDIGDRRAIEPLWTIFHSSTKDIGIQHDALIALSTMKAEQLYDLLISLLNHENKFLRQVAIRAFGNLGDKRAVELLIPLLRYHDEEIRIDTVLALGHLKDERALEPIIARISQSSLHEKRLIISSLTKIGGDKAVHALEAIINAEDKKSLDSPQYDRLRCDAVNALGQIDLQNATNAIQASLTHPKRGVRRHARKVLAKRPA
jgi:HEAT repeat protein